MRVSVWALAATLAIVASGCRGEPEAEKIAKSMIHVLDQEASEIEDMAKKLDNTGEMLQCKERLAKLAQEKRELLEAQKKIPEVELIAAKEKYKDELAKVGARLSAARKSLAEGIKIEKGS
jgi:hypothetical protein